MQCGTLRLSSQSMQRGGRTSSKGGAAWISVPAADLLVCVYSSLMADTFADPSLEMSP